MQARLALAGRSTLPARLALAGRSEPPWLEGEAAEGEALPGRQIPPAEEAGDVARTPPLLSPRQDLAVRSWALPMPRQPLWDRL